MREQLLRLLLLLVCFHTLLAGAAQPIWFVSWQHTGHIKALCPIALELQERGWEVRLAVHEEVTKLAPPGLQAVSVGNLPWEWEEELQFRLQLWDPLPPRTNNTATNPEEVANLKAELSEKYFLGSQRSLADGLLAALQAVPAESWPQLLVIDVSSVGAMDVAQKLDIPYAIVSGWPVGPTLQSIGELSAMALPWLPSELFFAPQAASQQGFKDRLKRYVMTSVIPWLMEINKFHKPRRDLRIAMGLHDQKWIELLEAPRWRSAGSEWPLVLVLSHWGLDRARPLPAHVSMIGPVDNYTQAAAGRPSLPAVIAEWLADESKLQVYVSFGTNVWPRPRMLRQMLGAMARLPGTRFLWDAAKKNVLERASDELDADEIDPKGSQNVLFAPRVDQLAVLASGQVAVFISHCGLNSVHEAMHFGVPVVGLPFLGDQLITAFLVEEKGAGVRMHIPNLSAENLADTVSTVGAPNGPHRRAASRVGQIAALAGGARSAADQLEAVAHFGGVHLQSIGDLDHAAGRLWDVRIALIAGTWFVICFIIAFVKLWKMTGQMGDEEETANDEQESNQVTNKKKKAKKA